MTARGSAYLVPVTAGLAVSMSSTALSGVLRGLYWLWFVLLSIAVVVTVGLLLRRWARLSWPTVVPVQLAALVALLTGLFSKQGILRVIPGPAALTELSGELAAAVHQIESGIPPVPTTDALVLLVSLGFGLVAVLVDPLVMAGHGAAVCGLVLLGAYTVPTALAPKQLPSWTLAIGATGYVLLLMVVQRERQARRGIPTRPAPPPAPAGMRGRLGRLLTSLRSHLRGAAGTSLAGAITAVAVLVALGLSSMFTVVGTGGRFPGGHGDPVGSPGEFGLNPFTSLRGQLEQDKSTELLRVRGLPAPEYVRSLTLSRYVPQLGWQLPDQRNGVVLGRNVPTGLPVPVSSPTAMVRFENVGYQDRWLPLYGLPMGVTGVTPDRWQYDVSTGTAFASGSVHEPSWTERAAPPDPDVRTLEALPGATDVNPTYLETTGIDPRIAELAAAVTKHAHTRFDQVVTLNRYFLDPSSGFRYSVKTTPGNTGDALLDFLTRSKTGYCEQFSAAMAVMLRTLGIPSRIAVGFTAGDQVDDYWSIGTSDAHAWVEAFFPGQGWLTFDPTPLDDGRTVVPSYVADAPNIPVGETPPALAAAAPPGGPQAGPDPAGGAPPPGQDPTGAGGSHDAGQPAQPSPATPNGEGNNGADSGGGAGSGDAGSGNAAHQDDQSSSNGDPSEIPSALLAIGLSVLALLVLGLLAALPSLARRQVRRARLRRAARGGTDGAEAAWREMLADFEDRGTDSRSNDTVRGAAKRLALAHGLDPRAVDDMRTVVGAVERGWYAGPSSEATRRGVELVAAVTSVHGGLDRCAPKGIAERLWPRSLRPPRGWWRVVLRGRSPK